MSSNFRGEGRSTVYTPDELLPVDTYREYVIRALPRPEPMEMRVVDALGLVVVDDVRAHEPLPGFANSAMDGYAVRSADIAAATNDTPVDLRVTGEVVAGDAPGGSVAAGESLRIMTGAPLPAGADAVVPVELTIEQDGRVRILQPARGGAHVRPVGQDVSPGDLLVGAGQRLNPGAIGLLTAAGIDRVMCVPTPRVAVLSTGDELVPGAHHPGPGQLRDSNGPMLAAMVRRAGAIAFVAGPVGDTRAALTEALQFNLSTADMVLMTGGVSAGTRDLVAEVVDQLGEAARFKVAMQPGMPQVVGRIGRVPVFGLPGNPVSAFVSFEVFIRPALRVLQGRRDLLRPATTAVLGADVTSPAHKRSYLRVRLHRDGANWVATPTGHQGSHVLSSIAMADALAEVPEDVTSLSAGDPIAVHLLIDA